MCRPSKIDVSTFEDRCRLSKIDVSTFEDRRMMCRSSKMDDRCADLRRSMAVVSTSKTDDRCEIMLLHLLKTLMV